MEVRQKHNEKIVLHQYRGVKFTECDVPGTMNSWYRQFSVCFEFSEPVSEKFGTEKVPVSVSEIFGTGKSIGIGIVYDFGYRHSVTASHSAHNTYL